jgi:hypothetical protein
MAIGLANGVRNIVARKRNRHERLRFEPDAERRLKAGPTRKWASSGASRASSETRCLSAKCRHIAAFRARPYSVCVRDGLAAWGGRILTSAFQNLNSLDSQPRRRDSNLCIWDSDPLHSLSRKRGFDAVRWSPETFTNQVRPTTVHQGRKKGHAGRITLGRAHPAN